MDNYNVPILVEAKNSYTIQLVQILKPVLLEGILSIYAEAKDYCEENNQPDSILLIFQRYLSNIPRWTNQEVCEETEKVLYHCDWIEDLITAIFVSHTKILAAIKVNADDNSRNVTLKIPSTENFLHKIYEEMARTFWKKSYLLRELDDKIKYQMNLNMCEDLIEKCITDSVVKMIPVKDILSDVLAGINEPEVGFEGTEPDSNKKKKKSVPIEEEDCEGGDEGGKAGDAGDMDGIGDAGNTELDLDSFDIPTQTVKPIDDAVRINDIAPPQESTTPPLPPTPPTTPVTPLAVTSADMPIGDICQELNMPTAPQQQQQMPYGHGSVMQQPYNQTPQMGVPMAAPVAAPVPQQQQMVPLDMDSLAGIQTVRIEEDDPSNVKSELTNQPNTIKNYKNAPFRFF